MPAIGLIKIIQIFLKSLEIGSNFTGYKFVNTDDCQELIE